MLTPEQIARALADRFHLLTGGSRTVMPRHQTLHSSLDWSHELLREDERTLLRRLSVFAGGWTLDAAEQVCPGEGIDRYDVLDLLTGLVDKSLVATDEQDPETRYRLLETVRQYATARLVDAAEIDDLHNRHLAYYLALAETAAPQVLGAGRDDPALHTLATELSNLRAALEQAAATDPNAALRLVAALTLFWLFTGRYRKVTPPTGALWKAQQVGAKCGDIWAQGRAYHILGLMASFRDPAGERALLERSVELATQAGDDWCRISALQVLVFGWLFQDEFDTARPMLDDAYAAAVRLGYRRGFAWHWFCLRWEALCQGRPDPERSRQ